MYQQQPMTSLSLQTVNILVRLTDWGGLRERHLSHHLTKYHLSSGSC